MHVDISVGLVAPFWSGRCNPADDVGIRVEVVMLFAVPAITVQYPVLAGNFLGMS